jgi:hypothetical protein
MSRRPIWTGTVPCCGLDDLDFVFWAVSVSVLAYTSVSGILSLVSSWHRRVNLTSHLLSVLILSMRDEGVTLTLLCSGDGVCPAWLQVGLKVTWLKFSLVSSVKFYHRLLPNPNLFAIHDHRPISFVTDVLCRWYGIIIIIISGVSPLGTADTIGLLYQPQMMRDRDCGGIDGMKIARGSRSTVRKPTPVSLCPPRIPHDLSRARTWAAAVGSQRLTAWAIARPNSIVK